MLSRTAAKRHSDRTREPGRDQATPASGTIAGHAESCGPSPVAPHFYAAAWLAPELEGVLREMARGLRHIMIQGLRDLANRMRGADRLTRVPSDVDSLVSPLTLKPGASLELSVYPSP